MRPYEFLDISGDAGIRSFGSTAMELFVNAALGMYNLMMDMEDVKKTERIEVALTHETAEGLLVAWLNELIFRFDAYGFIGKEIIVTNFVFGEHTSGDAPPYSISASLSGEYFEPGRHHGKLLLKAATYHKLKIRDENGRWTAEIIFDV